MVVLIFAHLNELDLAPKMIYHLLEPADVPPFDRHVELTASYDDPERSVFTSLLVNLRIPPLFLLGDVNVSSEGCGLDVELKTLVQEVDEAVQTMVRSLVAAVDQRVVAMDHLDLRIALRQR